MTITLNGEFREVAPGTTVAELLGELDVLPKHVAVEVNLELVPRTRHAQHVLSDNDRLEVVTLFGGG
jgi:sulfur carrier protein